MTRPSPPLCRTTCGPAGWSSTGSTWSSVIWRRKRCCCRCGWATSTTWRIRKRCRSTATGGRAMTRNDETPGGENTPTIARQLLLTALWAGWQAALWWAVRTGHDWLAGAGALGLGLHFVYEYRQYP